MRPKRVVRVAAVITTVGAVAAIVFASPLWSKSRLDSIPTVVVQKGAFVDYLQVRGEIRPVRSIVLTAPLSGTDMQIVELAANGAAVSPGDLVVRFDPTTQQRAIEQRQSELKQAEAEIDRVETESARRIQAADAELAQARSALERARLDATGVELIPRVEAEKRTLLLSNAQLQVVALERKVEGERMVAAADVAIVRQKRDKAQSDLAEAERLLEMLTLRAPAAGTISLLANFRAGGPMSSSAPEFKRGDRVFFGAPIAELPDLTAIRMTSRLDEADRARIQNGSAVLVRVDALPDRELKGHIEDIAMMARPDFSSFPPARNFDAVIAIEDLDSRLRPGMSASGRIEMNRLADVIVVPASAVFQSGGTTVVYVVDGGAAVARPITVLRRGRDQTAIQSGVAEGERISLRDLADGASE